MPELPEVETAKRLVESVSRRKKITAVSLVNDPIIFMKTTPAKLRRELIGEIVAGVHRHGKYFWIKLKSEKSLVFHMGMSGWIHRVKPGQANPNFTKLLLEFNGTTKLAFTDPRRLGRVWVTKDIASEPRIAKLGRDVLNNPMSVPEVFAITAKRSIAIKALLLNQEIFAGVGNWIADEALYQAGISPHRPSSSLTKYEVRTLLKVLAKILLFAVKQSADDSKFPATWLFHSRWKKGRKTTKGQLEVKFDTIAGRTSAWVPSKQH